MKRSSGVLLPLASVPSPYGIGTMGKAAYGFIDFLRAAGQSWWQILPLGIADAAGSPYSSVSAFAGDPDYIDLDLLAEDGLLDGFDLAALAPADTRRVDYKAVRSGREAALRAAFRTGAGKYAGETAAFSAAAPWLGGCALYLALKRKYDEKPWYEWPEDIKRRRPDAVSAAEAELRGETDYYMFQQFLFFRQWSALKKYAGENGVGIIGDLPFYVAGDSADVWTEPWFFRLGPDCLPSERAGVPPDYFSAEGQLWGNPLYDWERMRGDGWGWWIRRADGASKLYDAVRVDHFRAFASYWSVPAGEKTAKNGRWRPGPGMDLVGTLTNWFPGLQFIAEDLGVNTPDVESLLKKSGLPGMKVLEFAFSPDGTSDYLPHRFSRSCVCYAGTHDNDTVLGWLAGIEPEERAFAEKYLAVGRGESWCRAMLRCGMASVADIYISQMQDLLELPSSCRTNTPGTSAGNWRWRLLPDECTPELAAELREYTKVYGR